MEFLNGVEDWREWEEWWLVLVGVDWCGGVEMEIRSSSGMY